MDWKSLLQSIVNWCTSAGLRLIIAIIVMVIAFKLINKLAKVIEKRNDSKKYMDKTIFRTLVSAGAFILKVLVALCLINYVGINTSGVTALIASLGVAAGLALNGALGNVAGGILLLVTRPFKVDDFVDINGTAGTVEEINLTATKVRTNDNVVVYVPNGTASTSTIKNYSEKQLRRVDHTFTIGYDNDLDKAKAVIEMVLNYNEKVLKDPAWQVRVIAHTERGLELVCRAWVEAADYWDVYFDLLEQVKMAFDENAIEIPYSQVNVHIKQDAPETVEEED
jgi:small conductance mechanosensitive channel